MCDFCNMTNNEGSTLTFTNTFEKKTLFACDDCIKEGVK